MRRALVAALALLFAVSGQGYADVDRSAETGRKRAQNQPLGAKEFRYRAFGERINLSGGAPGRTDPSFQNRTYDAGLGIYDYRNRSFDPSTGRFLQRDPVLGGDELFNPYCFPGNNPVTNGDPMGTVLEVEGVTWSKEKLDEFIGESGIKGDLADYLTQLHNDRQTYSWRKKEDLKSALEPRAGVILGREGEFPKANFYVEFPYRTIEGRIDWARVTESVVVRTEWEAQLVDLFEPASASIGEGLPKETVAEGRAEKKVIKVGDVVSGSVDLDSAGVGLYTYKIREQLVAPREVEAQVTLTLRVKDSAKLWILAPSAKIGAATLEPQKEGTTKEELVKKGVDPASILDAKTLGMFVLVKRVLESDLSETQKDAEAKKLCMRREPVLVRKLKARVRTGEKPIGEPKDRIVGGRYIHVTGQKNYIRTPHHRGPVEIDEREQGFEGMSEGPEE